MGMGNLFRSKHTSRDTVSSTRKEHRSRGGGSWSSGSAGSDTASSADGNLGANVVTLADVGSGELVRRRRTSSSPDTSSSSSSGDQAGHPSSTRSICPSIEHVPSLIHELATVRSTSSERANKALRKLFAVSEHSSFQENRIDMVRVAEGRLIPVLLDVLLRCEKGSPEQFLTLLVLNNISIPNENKRLIALEHQGVKVLSQLLCDDPSCHLVSIVLVNLTFCDAETTRELMSDPDLQLVESLAFGLRIASLTQLEYEHRQPLVESDPENPSSTVQLLANMLTEDQRQRTSCNAENFCLHLLPPPSRQLFPETAQWTMSAIKNLTRPCNDPNAAQALIRVGIVPHIFRFITVSGGRHPNHGSSSNSIVSASQDSKSSMIILTDVDCDDGVIKNENAETSDRGGVDSCDSSALTPIPSDPMKLQPASVNSPTTWDSGSAQDAALFVVLNLSATPSAREYMRELDAIHILTAITNYYPVDSSSPDDYVKQELLEFQRLKARMALSYLIGSEGHYGQGRARKGLVAASAFVDQDESCLIVTDGEVTRLVELLATALHHRAKDGAGGYSAATFSVKYVLLSLRCLLTHYENQVKFAQAQGAQVNALLMKVLAHYSLQRVDYIDEEGAEHAAFSLYLLSNYCFTVCVSLTLLRSLLLLLGVASDQPLHSLLKFAETFLTKYLWWRKAVQEPYWQGSYSIFGALRPHSCRQACC